MARERYDATALYYAIADHLIAAGHDATVEYPDFISFPANTGDGRHDWVYNVGHANETWSGDLTSEDGSEVDDSGGFVTCVPSDEQDAAVIARAILVALASGKGHGLSHPPTLTQTERDAYAVKHARLEAAFARVRPTSHWKDQIHRWLPLLTASEKAEITEAVIYFTGSVPVFTDIVQYGKTQVTAAGYYATIGS